MIQSASVNGNEKRDTQQILSPTKWQQALLFGVSAAILLFDQLSKGWIERNLDVGQALYPMESIEHIFRIVHVQNRGAAFGLFQGGGWIFTVIAFVVTAFILYYNTQLPGNQKVFRVALGLQLGGALGNVIDRFRLGHVTDFVHFNLRPLVTEVPALDFQILNWPVFNVADTSIVTGVIILAYLILTEKPERVTEPTATESIALRAPSAPVVRATPINPHSEPLPDLGDTRLARFMLISTVMLGLTAVLAMIIIPKTSLRSWRRRRKRRRRAAP